MWKIVILQQEKLLHQGPQPNFLSRTIFGPARGLFNAFGGLFVWLIVCFFVCLFVLFLAFLVVLQSQLPPPHLSSDERCSPAVKRHGRCLWLESGETRWSWSTLWLQWKRWWWWWLCSSSSLPFPQVWKLQPRLHPHFSRSFQLSFQPCDTCVGWELLLIFT